MTESQANSINWREGFSGSTLDPKVSLSLSDEVPTLAATTILGVTVVVLLAIVFVFVLGILIDCRQQRLVDIKHKPIRRLKLKKPSSSSQGDGVCIANNMEEPEMSLPPLEVIRHVP